MVMTHYSYNRHVTTTCLACWDTRVSETAVKQQH
jgi:hypothetical protein